MLNNPQKSDQDKLLLQMAQSVNSWQQTIDDKQEEMKLQSLCSDSNAITLERTQKL